MALINWDDEEKKDDGLFGATPVKQVTSVQAGSWQPAPSGADSAVATDNAVIPQQGGIFGQPQAPQRVQGNYLLSEEKAQADEQKRQRDAKIAEANRQAAEVAAARSQDAQNSQTQTQQGQSLNVDEIKKDEGWKRYYDEEFNKEKSGLDFWGRLTDGGQASARAEVNARNRYNAELNRRAYDDMGNVLNPNAAEEASKLTAYNSSLSQAGSDRSTALARAIGATRDNQDAGFWDKVKSTINAERQMSVYDAIVGADDAQNISVNDAGRLVGGLFQGLATAPTVGGKALFEAGTGEGTDYSTGLQKELDGGERVGRGISGGVDIVGSFFGGSGDLVKALSSKVVSKTATEAEKTLLKRLTKEVLIPSLIEGGENAVQAGAEYFGNDGSLLDENGDIDADKIAEFVTQVGQGAATGVVGGAAFSGAAVGVNRLRDGRPMPTAELDAQGTPPPLPDSNVSFESAVPANTPTQPTDFSTIPEFTPVRDIATTPNEVAPANQPIIAAPVETPVNVPPAVDTAQPQDVTPVSDAPVVPPAPVTPAVPTEQTRALQESRAGKSQAEEAMINQKLQNLDNVTPTKGSLPDDMSAGSEVVSPTPLTREQVAERLMPKLADNSDMKTRIANAVDMGKDAESPVRDILREGGVKPRQAERVAKQFDKLEEQLMEYNRLEEMNQKAYADGGTDALSPDVSRDRSRAAREMGITTRRLMNEIKRIEGSRDYKTRLINSVVDVIGTRNASVLSSAGLLERNIFQELTANAKLAIKNPIKMTKSTFGSGNILKDTAKAELSNWKDAPRNPIEAIKYVVGNTYRTGMIPTTALANTRRSAVRDELTKWAFQELEGRKVSSKEARKLAGTAGNEMEALVNTFVGVDNGMTNRKQATDALAAWKEYIRTGDDGAKTEFLKKVENHNSLADQMIAGLSKEDATRARGLMAMKNLIFPFVRTATNLAKNTVRQDLNPFAKSLLDEIRADQRSGGANAINLVKSKLVDYGIMGGAAALASSGVLVYNDGDEIDKPRGWSIRTGDGTYMPVRSTSLELPIALAGAAQKMATDIASGDAREWQYYAGMVTNSLPYIDQFNTTTGAVDSAMSGEDGGYAAKSYAINTAKSFVPFSNNGVQAYVAGKQGESLNAKTVYDDDLMTWFANTVKKSYDPDFYNSLKDSRDNAGRVRTVDNQGIISNKSINDPNTAEFNDRITDLVDYGREAGIGKSTQDMFNTYDTGKNNNFKSVQDTITFLDVPDGESPDNAKKLEKNGKLSGLSQQIREGFYGDTGSELLTLDGKNLKSDASVPNKAGTKNSKLPISMDAIKNAVAQTDLPKEDSDRLFRISNQNSELYTQLKDKAITYEQYSEAKAKLNQKEAAILSQSESYQRLLGLMDELDESGFFDEDGLGSTKSGQTYLWNSLNALLGSKGATPAAQYPEDDKGFTPWGGGSGRGATNKPGDRGNEGIRWTPAQARQMAKVAAAKYTPLDIKVKLGNEVKRDRSQNYTDRSF